jgi:hypothetical protein
VILRPTFDQIKNLLTIEKISTNYQITLKGGQYISGKNFFYISEQIKQRFDLEITPSQLKKIFEDKIK